MQGFCSALSLKVKGCFCEFSKIALESVLKQILKRKHVNTVNAATFSTIRTAKGTGVIVFDRKTKRLQRDRAALNADTDLYDYVKDEFGYQLADKICDIKRRFDLGVELGCGKGMVSKNIYSDMVSTVHQCELSTHTLNIAQPPPPDVITSRVAVDEEHFPFRHGILDIVFSSLSLHWVNDLPGCFRQVFTALRSDGVFIGSMFGRETLHQLRVALQLAELEREGGFSPHVSPFINVQDLGNLLNQAGYVMLTIDVDEMVVSYPSIFELMIDLKGMAENNCAWSRRPGLHRDTMIAAAAIYKELYGHDGDGGVPATFQVISFIGWKPDTTQPKPAKRGSGKVSFKDIGHLSALGEQLQNPHGTVIQDTPAST